MSWTEAILFLTNPNNCQATLSIWYASDIQPTLLGITLNTLTYGVRWALESGVLYFLQPTGGFGSGFLIAPDILVTSGDNVEVGVGTRQLNNIRFLTGFQTNALGILPTILSNQNVYQGVEVIDRVVDPQFNYAIIRLDREVEDILGQPHTVNLTSRQPNDPIPANTQVYEVGHPAFLPLKAGSSVLNQTISKNAVQFPQKLIAPTGSLCAAPGSPVFNSSTHVLEGFEISGENLFFKGKVGSNPSGVEIFQDAAPLVATFNEAINARKKRKAQITEVKEEGETEKKAEEDAIQKV